MTTDGVPSWEEVARDHGRFLYNVAYRLTGNDDDARDLVQESLLRVRRGLETYQPGSLEGWLARIVTNVFLDEVRRKRRRPVQALPDDPDRVLPADAGADDVAAAAGLSTEIREALAARPRSSGSRWCCATSPTRPMRTSPGHSEYPSGPSGLDSIAVGGCCGPRSSRAESWNDHAP